jgi:hypothetical protein
VELLAVESWGGFVEASVAQKVMLLWMARWFGKRKWVEIEKKR